MEINKRPDTRLQRTSIDGKYCDILYIPVPDTIDLISGKYVIYEENSLRYGRKLHLCDDSIIREVPLCTKKELNLDTENLTPAEVRRYAFDCKWIEYYKLREYGVYHVLRLNSTGRYANVVDERFVDHAEAAKWRQALERLSPLMADYVKAFDFFYKKPTDAEYSWALKVFAKLNMQSNFDLPFTLKPVMEAKNRNFCAVEELKKLTEEYWYNYDICYRNYRLA